MADTNTDATHLDPPAPPAPLPAAVTAANVTSLSEADIDRLAQKLSGNFATMIARSAQPAPTELAPSRTFGQPSTHMGAKAFCWLPDSSEPLLAFVTREYLDPQHPDYVDLLVCPPGESPRPVQSVPRLGTPGAHVAFYELA